MVPPHTRRDHTRTRLGRTALALIVTGLTAAVVASLGMPGIVGDSGGNAAGRPAAGPTLERDQVISQRPLGRPTSWRAGFEGPTLSEWSFWLRNDGGTFYAAAARSEGLRAHSGSAVGLFKVTRSQLSHGNIHSKLYKLWALRGPELGWRDDAGRSLERLPNDSPGGLYAAWYYLPRNYRNLVADWSIIFQFKVSYLARAGDESSWHQDPQWWVALMQDRRRPELIISNWSGRPLLSSRRPAPRGRWFQIAADLHPHDRIDWYVNGKLWRTTSARVYPVGISRRSTGWTFGVGHYGGIGRLWVDDASFTAR